MKLYKKDGVYKDKKTGKEKRITNFYLECGNTLVPINVPYFPNSKCDDRDPQYQVRIGILSSFAEILPEKDNSKTVVAK